MTMPPSREQADQSAIVQQEIIELLSRLVREGMTPPVVLAGAVIGDGLVCRGHLPSRSSGAVVRSTSRHDRGVHGGGIDGFRRVAYLSPRPAC